MATPGRGLQWWDRDVDEKGLLIRTDVRQAAHEVWPACCARVVAVLGDPAEAPELMEAAVAHISGYLNRTGIPPPCENAKSLVCLHFNQLLRRRACRLGRIDCVGTSADLDVLAPARGWDWVSVVNLRLDMEKVNRLLRKRSFTMFSMRLLGHDWKEVGEKLGISPGTARGAFWQEVRQARSMIERNGHSNGNGRVGKK